MNDPAQTIVALVIVAAATVSLVARAITKRRKPGCGGDCACPGSDLKTKLGAKPPAA